MIKSSKSLIVRLAIACVVLGGICLADDSRDNRQMLGLVSEVANKTEGSIAEVFCGSKRVALATVVGRDGFLLTKHSELINEPIRVRLGDNRIYPARIAATRRGNDLALLRVDANVDLQPIVWVDRTIDLASFVITPGRRGKAIAIGVVGSMPRGIEPAGLLGVRLSDASSGQAKVERVIPRSGAEEAGVQIGDLILSINGKVTRDRDTVLDTLKMVYPGEEVRLVVTRTSETSLDTQPSRSLDRLNSSSSNVELVATIREGSWLRETENDRKVNGRRNVRLTGFERVFQHDTVLEPEQCGGPVLDTQGNAVGLNIARAGRVVSYAMPASLLMREVAAMLNEAR